MSSMPSRRGFTSNPAPFDSAGTNLDRWRNPRTPSAKVAALVNMLKDWESNVESAMDKVIIYSQCKDAYLVAAKVLISSCNYRDLNARL